VDGAMVYFRWKVPRCCLQGVANAPATQRASTISFDAQVVASSATVC
jgi:hypothetical protein